MRTRGAVVVLCIRIGNEFRINLLRGAIGALSSITRDKIVTLSKKLLRLPKTPLRGVRFRRGTPDMLAAVRRKSGRRARSADVARATTATAALSTAASAPTASATAAAASATTTARRVSILGSSARTDGLKCVKFRLESLKSVVNGRARGRLVAWRCARCGKGPSRA